MVSIITYLIVSTPAYTAHLLADEVLEARRLERLRQEHNRRVTDLQCRALATTETRLKRILRR